MSTTSTASTATSVRPTRPADAPTPRGVRALAVLAALTTLTLFAQGVLAGQFVSQDGRDGWIGVHGAVADVSWLLALATAVVAFRTVRRSAPYVWVAAAALFGLDLAQTGLGHLITDNGQDWVIGVHVPLYFVLVALAVWLTVRTRALARRGQ